eukprot:UN16972
MYTKPYDPQIEYKCNDNNSWFTVGDQIDYKINDEEYFGQILKHHNRDECIVSENDDSLVRHKVRFKELKRFQILINCFNVRYR